MTCYRPIRAYRSLSRKTENGKSVIAFSYDDEVLKSQPFEEIALPCGKCIGCKMSRAKEFAARCVHEASLFNDNCFLTLTFDKKYLNETGSLVKEDFQKFMKRLRERFKGKEAVWFNGKMSFPIRYFHCGEYGANKGRPHHHALIFNFDFDDKVLWDKRKGKMLYRSKELEKLWKFGYSAIGTVTYESAAYVAGYIIKKSNEDFDYGEYYEADDDGVAVKKYVKQPEYVTMSRRPGIGRLWIEKFAGDIYPHDSCHINGREIRPPKYYDRIVFEDNPELERKVRKRRMDFARATERDIFDLRKSEKICKQRFKNIQRRYENGK